MTKSELLSLVTAAIESDDDEQITNALLTVSREDPEHFMKAFYEWMSHDEQRAERVVSEISLLRSK